MRLVRSKLEVSSGGRATNMVAAPSKSKPKFNFELVLAIARLLGQYNMTCHRPAFGILVTEILLHGPTARSTLNAKHIRRTLQLELSIRKGGMTFTAMKKRASLIQRRQLRALEWLPTNM
ncbi:hypothetical protein PGT21_011578 [Puccinia graminis f. sp. tritici]|uniref:Uncharacterized protein n=1 Tax=Puccinia graminis f. sp. tritici TaxID=56615 RepID=A0A5B0QN39_PUCGR|nr:hypothetical protein PGT21_011578 [Puccinia graminis f. sp. tritici]